MGQSIIMKACAALMLVLLALASADPTVIKRRAHVDPRDFALLAQEMSASEGPASESTEDFEIQCATSCKFVPSVPRGLNAIRHFDPRGKRTRIERSDQGRVCCREVL